MTKLSAANSMEEITLQRRDLNSDDGFSFPSTPVDLEFEFGSPTTSKTNSPADHLFLNGKLLPHSFYPPQKMTNSSRTSSVSSKDSSYYSSLMSSRSNSTNSSSSSARTSSFDNNNNSETRIRQQQQLYLNSKHQLSSTAIKPGRSSFDGYKPPSNKDVVAQLYGSQRWQFINPPVPSLSRETSSRRRRSPEQAIIKEEKKSKEVKKKKKKSICRRFFESFMVGCKQCHAMETQVLEDNHV